MSVRARESLITIAQSYVGTCGDTPAFQELLGPIQGNPNKWPLDKVFISGKQGVSTCAVVARGFLRKLGVPLGPYKTSSGLDDAIAYARQCGAWRTDKGPLREGGVVELQGATSIHVLTIEKIEGSKIHSIDGGQTGKGGLQAIARCVRTWTPGFLNGVPIVGWIDPGVSGFVGDEALVEYPPKSESPGTFAALLAAVGALYFWKKWGKK